MLMRFIIRSLVAVPCHSTRPGGLRGRFVQVYRDNILNYFKTHEQHLMHVRMVLETLLHHKLYAMASKCQFGRSSVGLLGYIISQHGVAVDRRKVVADAERATPTDVRARTCVGLATTAASYASPRSQPCSRPSTVPSLSLRGCRPKSRASTRSKRR